jgi:hypothetical protein
MKFSVKRYGAGLKEDWAHVLADARNGIFIFDRKFVEYHGDRFTDFSVIAYLDDKPVALMPASIDLVLAHVSSHAGLTFGGVVLKRELRGEVAIGVINAVLDALKEWGAKTLTLKLLPQVFCTYPSADLEYTLWRRGFELVRRDLSSILPLRNSLPFNTLKRQNVRKAGKAGLIVGIPSLTGFHTLLQNVLRAQHGVSPVHSLEELELLAARFPDQIFVRAAIKGDELLAGTLIFNYDHVWHTQYLACSKSGRALGALDLVINSIIDEARDKGVAYLSFGTSTESAGTVLNEGLLWQKESYGARSIVHDSMQATL